MGHSPGPKSASNGDAEKQEWKKTIAEIKDEISNCFFNIAFDYSMLFSDAISTE